MIDLILFIVMVSFGFFTWYVFVSSTLSSEEKKRVFKDDLDMGESINDSYIESRGL